LAFVLAGGGMHGSGNDGLAARDDTE